MKLDRKYLAAKWMLEEWHPRPSMFELPARVSVEELRREGDSLRRQIEGRRVLDCCDE